MTSTLLATSDKPFMDHLWVPVWAVLAVLIVVGALVWFFAQPDRKDAGGEALCIGLLGPLFAFFWPIFVIGGLFVGFLWSLYRLRLRMYPRLRIPATDLRTKYPVDEIPADAYGETTAAEVESDTGAFQGPGVETQH